MPRTRTSLLYQVMYTNFLPTCILQLFLKNSGSNTGIYSHKNENPPNTHYLPLPPGCLSPRLDAPTVNLPPACLPQKNTPQLPVNMPPQLSNNSLASPTSLFLNGAGGNQAGSSMSTSSRMQVECPTPG